MTKYLAYSLIFQTTSSHSTQIHSSIVKKAFTFHIAPLHSTCCPHKLFSYNTHRLRFFHRSLPFFAQDTFTFYIMLSYSTRRAIALNKRRSHFTKSLHIICRALMFYTKPLHSAQYPHILISGLHILHSTLSSYKDFKFYTVFSYTTKGLHILHSTFTVFM